MSKVLAIRVGIAIGLISIAGLTSPVATGKSNKVKLATVMNGAQEHPGPGDPDGRGKVKIVIRGTTVCFKLKWKDIATPLTGGHIHEAPAGAAGPIVVDLLANAERIKKHKAKGCVTDPDATRIAANPAGFYVNLHNANFRAGAIRGQLEKK